VSQPSFGVDGYQTEQELRRWAADVQAKAERYQSMQAQVAEVTVTESSRDDVVQVTVGSSGVVTDLRISDRSRELSGAEIANLVLTTMRRAQSKITEKVADVMQRTVGDDPAAVASVVRSYEQRFPEPEPEPEPAARNGDEEMRLGELPDEAPRTPPPAGPPRRPRRQDDDDDWGDPTVLT
jgi:DNA-binding protein YbaB